MPGQVVLLVIVDLLRYRRVDGLSEAWRSRGGGESSSLHGAVDGECSNAQAVGECA